jgi:hypothetical protein
MTRLFYLTLFLIACIASSGQRIPQYATLDSVKKTQKLAETDLSPPLHSVHEIDSVKEFYSNIKDSLRDRAHDYADSIIDHMDKCSHFELGFDFASRQLIYGRKGPATSIVGSPSLKYIHRTGIYAMFNTDEYGLQYKKLSIQKRPAKIDTVNIDKIESDIILTAGFARTFWERWDVDASFDHTFIFYGQDKNYLSTGFNVNTSYDFWSYISLNVYYTILFGGKSKSSASDKAYSNLISIGLSHDIQIYRFLGAKVFTITPEFIADMGNDNYVRNRLLARNENGGLTVAKPTSDNFFGLLNLEGSLNIDYRIKNLEVYIDPRVAIPFNVVPVNAVSPVPYRNNKTTGSIVYVTVGVKYLFRFWKEHHHRS